MRYWGWRTLMLSVCISVLVTGCYITSEHAPTAPPTDLPLVTLTVRLQESPLPPPATQTPPPTPTTAVAVADVTLYTVRPGDTLLGIALDSGVSVERLREFNPDINPRSLQVGQQVIIPVGHPDTASVSPTPVTLAADPPACHETPAGSILCLGQITNPQPYPVERVRVKVALIDSTGAVLAAREAPVEQAAVLPGQSAPFAVVFESTWRERYSRTAAYIMMAHPAPHLAQRLVLLRTEHESATFTGGRYTVAATLHNPSDHFTGSLRLVLALFNADDEIIGYRVNTTRAGLAPGERLYITIDAIPQPGEYPLRHTLYTEAFRSG